MTTDNSIKDPHVHLAQYIVADPDEGMFVNVIEAYDAVMAVHLLHDEYGKDTKYKLYVAVGVKAYEKAQNSPPLHPNAHSASSKR